jgi:hypothetical protein
MIDIATALRRKYYGVEDVDKESHPFLCYANRLFDRRNDVSATMNVSMTPLFKNQFVQCWIETSYTTIGLHISDKSYDLRIACVLPEDDNEEIYPINIEAAIRVQITKDMHDELYRKVYAIIAATGDMTMKPYDATIDYRWRPVDNIPELVVLQSRKDGKALSSVAYCKSTFDINGLDKNIIPKWLVEKPTSQFFMYDMPEYQLATILGRLYSVVDFRPFASIVAAADFKLLSNNGILV